MTIGLNKKLMIICLIQVFLFSALFAPVAYGANTQHVELPIKQNIVSENEAIPQDLTFMYQLVPKTSGAPMPGNLEKYTFSINGDEDFITEQIFFQNPGIFIYEVNCITDSKTDFSIDRRIFKIEVHVTISGETFVIIRNGNGDKVQNMVFEHVYKKQNTGGSGNNGGGDDSDNRDNEDNIGKTDTTEKPSLQEKPKEAENEETENKADLIEDPKSSGAPGDDPKTGAAGDQKLWLILMFLSGLFMILFLFKKRKSNTNTNAATL